MKSTKDNQQNSMTRKEVLRCLGGLILAPWMLSSSFKGIDKPVRKTILEFRPGDMTWPFELPELPYPVDALEPVIDRQTMRIHHRKHHQGYTDKLNRALEDHPGLWSMPLGELLSNLNELPGEVRTAVRNNGGGYYNHTLFWSLLREPQEKPAPPGTLAEAITRDFGSLENFKEQFNEAAGGVFGSGWAWLAVGPKSGLQIVQVPNQDTVLAAGLHPVLGIDVWEHAYYLKYQNRRSEYINHFWKIVNWKQAEANYEQVLSPGLAAG